MISYEALEMVDRLRAAKTIDECLNELEVFVSAHGVEHFAIAEFAGPVGDKRLFLSRFPDEWTETYVRNRYEYFDPVTHGLLTGGGRDLIWADLHKLVRERTKGWYILNEGAEFGLQEGITFPLFGPSGYLAGATFAAPSFDDDPQFRAALSLVATYAHSQLLRLQRYDRFKSDEVSLTAREREVVEWVANGKTDWEIGEILCISEYTAQKHIENAKQKLGVQKRTQVVVEAIRRSLIQV